jgi:hypothetical protein
MRASGALLVLGAAQLLLGACGQVALGPSSDAATSSDSATGTPNPDAGTTPVKTGDAGSFDDGHVGGHDATLPDDATQPDTDASGITYVDAGYYRGDGSFFVDGGAYPDVGTQLDASVTEGGGIDASPGCVSLAACCPSLQSGLQGVCNEVVAQGNAVNCAAELGQLEATGDCSGVSVLASQVQVPANRMASDGTLLFWTTASTPGLLAMPVGGGEVTILLDGPLANTDGYSGVTAPNDTLLAVDDINIYVLMNNALVRIPKRGGPATLVSVGAAVAVDATVLGTTAYWVAWPNGGEGPNAEYPLQSAPLLGGPVSTIALFEYPGAFATDELAVTSSTAFVGSEGPEATELFDFLLGTPAITTSLLESCVFLTSDENAIYCAQNSGSNFSIASDDTATALGPAINSSYIVFDNTYAYWADMTTVGTIMKAPKAGGGTATVLAYDTSPTAIAVDANSIYWSDQGGYIKSVPK